FRLLQQLRHSSDARGRAGCVAAKGSAFRSDARQSVAARAALRRNSGTIDRTRRQFPVAREIDDLPFRRVAGARADESAAAVARTRGPGASAQCTDGGDATNDGSARHIRRRRLVATRILRTSTVAGGAVYFDREPLSLQ